jgi:hypothetical protein
LNQKEERIGSIIRAIDLSAAIQIIK